MAMHSSLSTKCCGLTLEKSMINFYSLLFSSVTVIKTLSLMALSHEMLLMGT